MQSTMDLETLRKLEAEEVPSPPYLRAIIHNRQTSCLIGHQGQTAKYVTTNFKTFFQVYETEGSKWGRLVNTRGYPNALGKTWYYFAQLLIKQYFEHTDFGIDFVFPTLLVDLFLSAGEFDYITKNTTTTILVKHQCLMRSTERVVRIETRGKDEASLNQFETAVSLLATAVQKNITLALCAPENIFYIENADDNLWKYCKRDAHDILFDSSLRKSNGDDEKVLK